MVLKVRVLRKDGGNIPENAQEPFFSNIYAHGVLEAHFGFDICAVLNIDDLPKRSAELDFIGCGKTQMTEIDYNGIMPCAVEGYDKPCTAFLWVPNSDNVTKGIIIDNEDIDSISYASLKLNKRDIII